MKLVIVDSPTKSWQIGKFLDADYNVVTCYGNIRELPENNLGIHITDDKIDVQFETPQKTLKTLDYLKKEAKKANVVYLASNPDSEGETIAYHLQKNVSQNKEDTAKFKRITFNEITEAAVKSAIQNPRNIDHSLVASQLSRSIIDRLMKYKLSQAAKKASKKSIPLDLLQAAALQMIITRENEISGYKPEKYFSIHVDTLNHSFYPVRALSQAAPIDLNEETASEMVGILEVKKALEIIDIISDTYTLSAPSPFTTSSLLQASSISLGISPEETMEIALKLYECGLITFPQTDSTFLSNGAKEMAFNHIQKKYGDTYTVPNTLSHKETGCSEAEAIRPTTMKLLNGLAGKEKDIFLLIAKRFIASQMPGCKIFRQIIKAKNDALTYSAKQKPEYGDILFINETEIISFDGFFRILPENNTQKFQKTAPDAVVGEKLIVTNLVCQEHHTTAPCQYSEASLIKEFAENGLGCPSTYASTIKILTECGYIEHDAHSLQSTEKGKEINSYLTQHFPEITELCFTAEIEQQLNNIASGQKWKPYIISLNKRIDELLEKEAI